MQRIYKQTKKKQLGFNENGIYYTAVVSKLTIFENLLLYKKNIMKNSNH